MMTENHSPKFTRSDWFNLFLLCAFPLHLWTLLMAFRDVGWVAQRTTVWDALGFASYALLYTLVESGLLFGFIALLSLFTPRTWGKKLRFTVLGVLAFSLAGWSIIEQLILIIFFGTLRKLGIARPWLVSPDWVPLAIMAVLVAVSVAVPVLLLRRNPNLQDILHNMFERLTTLSLLYLVLDAAAILIIVIRNLAG